MCPVADNGSRPRAPAATLSRRSLALVYEALLLTALVFAGSLPFVMLTRDMSRDVERPLFQCYLVVLIGLYFVWQWRHGGQTLALKTWRMRVVTREDAPLSWGHAVRRYAFALPGILLLGAGFLWALVDRERLFLHDRLAGTRIVMTEDGRT
jgi:uncharacterized RDD family membrane protein YckC